MDSRIVSNEPLHPEIGVLGLVPGCWGEMWQVRQHILTRLARYFHVVWCNKPRGWRDYWLPGANSTREPVPDKFGNMMIYTPGRWLPFLYRPVFVARLFEKKRLKQAIKKLRTKGCKHILLYIWRPEFGTALDLVDFDRSFYHIDDEYSFSSIEKETSAEEAALIGRSDQVFIHSPALMEKKGNLNINTLYVSNGVDFHAYSTPKPEPEDMKQIPHPRIGYTGIIKDQLDFELLSTLVERHMEWSFVFVGPRRNIGSIENALMNLEKKDNVFFLGGKPADELPGYVQHFDVCSLCYKIDGYTKFIYPLKINEYLATGRPVVGVPLPSIELFRDVVRIAQTSWEWSEAISVCLELKDNSEEAITRRQEVARRSDWDNQAALIARTMCDRAGIQYPIGELCNFQS